MPTIRVPAVTALLFFAAFNLLDFKTYRPRLPDETLPTPSARPQEWPNLDALQRPACSLDGAAPPGSPQAQINRLMNRYHLPTSFEELPLEYLQLNLPQGEIAPDGKLESFPSWEDPNNQRAVTVVGYVNAVRILGCKTAPEIYSEVAPAQAMGMESASCYVNNLSLCTATILMTSDPTLSQKNGRNLYAMKVTRRSRWLAKGGHLQSINVGNNWSTISLRKKLIGKWVRVSGWLFFSENFSERAWVSDPADKIGRPNERQTAWGIHPVMGIEVVKPPPGIVKKPRR